MASDPSTPNPNSAANSEDRLLGALAYALAPIVGIIVLLTESKNNPFENRDVNIPVVTEFCKNQKWF